MTRLKKVLFLTGLFFLSAIIPSFAQIRIDRDEVKSEILPGTELSETLIVDNISKEVVGVKAYFGDFEYVAPFDGRKQSLPLGSTAHSLANWKITISPAEFTLAPAEKKEIVCTITVPSDVHGSYYGVLLFEKVSSGALDGVSTGVGLTVRVGCPFILETKERTVDAVVADAGGSSKDKMQWVLKNTGDSLLVCKGFLNVMNSAGAVLERDKIDKLCLPVAESKAFGMKFTRLPAGEYSLVINLDIENSPPLIKEILFQREADGTLKVKEVRN
ncbi:MAG: hypothetical protein PHC33_00160 [Candidatus Omnitrophica bacterium]|nr:hypothetical protein [Candidatus Omnitrophota bacterium]